MTTTCDLDGRAFQSLEGFAEHFSNEVLGGGHRWHGNLDALNDILRGGFGTPDGGFTALPAHPRGEVRKLRRTARRHLDDTFGSG